MIFVLHVVGCVVKWIEDSVVNGQCTKSIHDILNTPQVIQSVPVVTDKVSDIKHFGNVVESLK
jgi:hypothetical protein